MDLVHRPRAARPDAVLGTRRQVTAVAVAVAPAVAPALTFEESLPLGSRMLEARYGSSLGGGSGGRGGLGGGKFVDALDDFAMLGLNKTV